MSEGAATLDDSVGAPRLQVPWRQTLTSELIRSKSLQIGDGYRAKNSELASSGLPFARAGNINNGFRFESADHLPHSYTARVGDKLSRPGDTVFTSKGTVGRFAYVRETTEPFVYSPQLCFWRSLNVEEIVPRFLFYWMQSKEFLEQVEGTKGQTDMADYVNLADQRRMTITLPPAAEQRTIAELLGTLDEKIDLVRRQNQTLEAMAETLFRQWFLEAAQDHWTEYSVGDFASHLKQGIQPGDQPSTDFLHFSLPAFDEGMRAVVETGSQILSNKFRVTEGVLLVSKLNPRVSRIWPIQKLPDGVQAICSTEFQVLKPKNPALFGYLYGLLTSSDAREALTMAASGTSGSHQRVRPEDILAIRTSLPNIDLAERFSSWVEPVLSRRQRNIEQIAQLERMRDTLLPKLMSGEVRVPF